MLDKEYEVTKFVLYGAYSETSAENKQKDIKLVYLNGSNDKVSLGKFPEMKDDKEQTAEIILGTSVMIDAVGIQVKSKDDKLKPDNKLRLSGI